MDDSKRSDTLGNRRTNTWIRDQQHRQMLEQEPQKGQRTESEEVAKTTREKTNSDQPRTDRSENSVATRSTARHEDLHRRPRGH